MSAPTLVWFRQDLRLADNPAVAAAASLGPVLPVYVLDETGEQRPLGGAAKWWLHQSLTALAGELADHGLPLILARGAAEHVIPDLVAAAGAGSVMWNRVYEPGPMVRDARLKAALRARGIPVTSHNGSLLFEAGHHRTGGGGLFQVFTPFWRALSAGAPPRPLVPVPALSAPAVVPRSEDLAAWRLRPTTPDWAGGLRATWTPGSAAATARLDAFLDGPVTGYAAARDQPGIPGTSRLSPHLHLGELSPTQVWHRARTIAAAHPERASGIEAFLRELGWREFSMNLLAARPSLPTTALKADFDRFPWRDDPADLTAWQRGQTGYPIVDAGMRELWQTGWMHNRVRMIVGSFLVKHLLADWRLGEAWFWDTLVDADLANNVASWQWVAGCGADAQPYFRIFNPMLQGAKFDPQGAYVRRYVPELARLPDALLHTPWMAPPLVLADAGVRLGVTYPKPIVDHAAARARALAALQTLKVAA